MTEIAVHTERVDDIPLLISQQQAMGLAEIINHLAPRHGNRQGLSLGELVIGWLAFILSESDHRLSYVEPWAAEQQQTLRPTSTKGCWRKTPRTSNLARANISPPAAHPGHCGRHGAAAGRHHLRPGLRTGGFLLAAYDHVGHNHQLDRDQWLHLRQEALHG
jgi:hypothetical protein